MTGAAGGTRGKRVRRQRRRYVAFEVVPPDVSRSALLGAIRGVWSSHVSGVPAGPPPVLIDLAEGYGVIRAEPRDAFAARERLAGVRWAGSKDRPVRIASLSTSGTLRGARHAIARKRRKGAPRSPP
ncbi:MAG TPA: hypothetical protein VM681_07030 [Candidatus Thermoplasmatota archaeon]|nr:hypothetical protein [Candidatus Thermoplasmatota archaeon]